MKNRKNPQEHSVTSKLIFPCPFLLVQWTWLFGNSHSHTQRGGSRRKKARNVHQGNGIPAPVYHHHSACSKYIYLSSANGAHFSCCLFFVSFARRGWIPIHRFARQNSGAVEWMWCNCVSDVDASKSCLKAISFAHPFLSSSQRSVKQTCTSHTPSPFLHLFFFSISVNLILSFERFFPPSLCVCESSAEFSFLRCNQCARQPWMKCLRNKGNACKWMEISHEKWRERERENLRFT